jgi:YfiH family protein
VLTAGTIVHAFSDRAAGNLGMAHGDPATVVHERRARFARSLGFEPDQIVRANQVHGDVIARVGRGAPAPEADALVTDEPGVLLMLLFADCVPVLLWDDAQVAAAHAGWKGTSLWIAARTVAAMGSHPAGIQAVIGPAIGPCCYEVSDEVAEAVGATVPDVEVARRGPRGRPHVDLVEANRAQLVAAGLRPESVAVAGVCTACNVARYFSHRAEHGRAGRFAGAIGMRRA